MTLRHRLLLVYLIVVLLSCLTVGIAVEEISHSRAVVNDLKRWQDIVLKVEKLRTAFERDVILRISNMPSTQAIALRPPEADFYVLLNQARGYLDFDEVRWEFSKLLSEYYTWRGSEDSDRIPHGDHIIVRRRLDTISHKLEQRLDSLLASSQEQDRRTVMLLSAVMILTVMHIAIVGTLLRLWLLRPMERLGRQVAALGRDEPPPEPLIASPAELAELASALDHARLSLDSMRGQLIESERLTTIGHLAAQLAHNLRNPLASIRAAAQIASRRENVEEYVHKRLDEIVTATDRLSRWVTGLTEFIRPQSANVESRNVVPLVQGLSDALAAELSAKELSLEIQAPTDGLFLLHEPPLLEQALIAVATNAIEASPIGSRITIRLEHAAPGDDGKPFGRICVLDQGPGLPEGSPDRIFELNYSTKTTGLGIGLTLARQAVQRQGGTITAHSNPDGGTIIEFRLPASASGEESN